MKSFFILLFLPFISFSQTIHRDDDDILYKGNVNIVGLAMPELTARLQNALQIASDESNASMSSQLASNEIVSAGEIKLNSTYHVKLTLLFNLRITPSENGYQYRIDSVKVREMKRYSRTTIKPSKELLEGIEETGLTAIEAERLLNEIDLRLQKLLTILEREARIGNGSKK